MEKNKIHLARKELLRIEMTSPLFPYTTNTLEKEKPG